MPGAPLVCLSGQGEGVNLFADQDREALRGAWRTAWQRHLERLPLEPLQAQMVDVLAMHPEYHPQLSLGRGAAAGATPSTPMGTDAYLHMALHLALREQLATDRPYGIAEIYRHLCAGHGEIHPAEHRMIEVLAQTLWEAQRAGRMPDEQHYLEALRRL